MKNKEKERTILEKYFEVYEDEDVLDIEFTQQNGMSVCITLHPHDQQSYANELEILLNTYGDIPNIKESIELIKQTIKELENI